MEFIFDEEEFDQSFLKKNGFTHAVQNSRIKVFPFATKEGTPGFQGIVSNYFCNSLGGEIYNLRIQKEELLNQLVENNDGTVELEIENYLKPVFRRILKERFFKQDLSLKRDGLQTLLLSSKSAGDTDNNDCKDERAAQKAGAYLWEVLGSKNDKKVLENSVRKAEKKAEEDYNVLESYFYEILKNELEVEKISRPDYYQVLSTFDDPFREDLLYLLSQNTLDTGKFKKFFSIYYFEYLAQMLMQLDLFLNGNKNGLSKIFFCVSWEKISQTRKCVTDGWNSLKQASVNMYPHAITLMIINMIKQQEGQPEVLFDYIALSTMIDEGMFEEQQVLEQIRLMTDTYRNDIKDSAAMSNYARKPGSNSINSEIRYLFESVKKQFSDSSRQGVPERFSNHLKNIALHFLAARGKLGYVLTIDEDMLLFLVSLVIKSEDTMRLNKVFTEFERRGVFFDYRSKEEIENYFEKLNLIEKKSDSGDAKYVRSIL